MLTNEETRAHIQLVSDGNAKVDKETGMVDETTPREVFVVFQGGGAKGIAHIGGVKALEKANVAIRGVAGTSAGAIVASLVAAGYSADEIFATDGSGNHLLMRINAELQDATKLFGVEGWSRLAWLNNAIAWAKKGVTLRRVTRLAWRRWHRELIEAGACVFATIALVWEHHPSALAWVLFMMTWMGLVFGGIRAWRLFRVAKGLSSGLAKTECVRDVINQALIQKLREPRPNARHVRPEVSEEQWAEMGQRGITFEQFERLSDRSLCVVATDITSKDVQPFSVHMTPNVPVADAVCASIGLPLIFELKHIEMEAAPQSRRCYYLDGGLLSNLPLWVFDEDRLLRPNIATIGFTLAESSDSTSDKPMAGLSWVAPAINTIVAGPSRIHRRGIDGLILIEIPTALGVLAFDGTNEEYCGEVERAFAAAHAQLKLQLEFPAQLKQNLNDIRTELIAAFDAIEAVDIELRGASFALKDGHGEWDLQVSIAVQREGLERLLRIDASTFHEDAGQKGRATLLEMDDSIAGEAWSSGSPVLFEDPDDHGVTPGARWQIALPIRQSYEDGARPPAIQQGTTAVILIVESAWFQQSSDPTADYDAPARRFLQAMAFATEKALNKFCLAFRENMEYLVTCEDAPELDESQVEPPKRILEFADQARQARLWQ